tara:strand:- start:3964 stop:4440 length:477 start_codon:yes stop_codon:yes gene_type:complete
MYFPPGVFNLIKAYADIDPIKHKNKKHYNSVMKVLKCLQLGANDYAEEWEDIRWVIQRRGKLQSYNVQSREHECQEWADYVNERHDEPYPNVIFRNYCNCEECGGELLCTVRENLITLCSYSYVYDSDEQHSYNIMFATPKQEQDAFARALHGVISAL